MKLPETHYGEQEANPHDWCGGWILPETVVLECGVSRATRNARKGATHFTKKLAAVKNPWSSVSNPRNNFLTI
jgi:hypothetical protein